MGRARRDRHVRSRDTRFPLCQEFSEAALQRHHYHGVDVSDVSATPYGFIWITARDRIAVRVETTGAVHRTLTFDGREELLSVTGGPDGRTYFGFEHRIEVFGAP